MVMIGSLYDEAGGPAATYAVVVLLEVLDELGVK
jgi:hypothetical protein